MEYTSRFRFGVNEVKSGSEKDRSAEEVVERFADFQTALTENKRRYPIQEFETFLSAARQYIALTETDRMVHRAVIRSINGLREFLQLERKAVPGSVLFEADRLETQFFAGYDPSFEGDEAPGL